MSHLFKKIMFVVSNNKKIFLILLPAFIGLLLLLYIASIYVYWNSNQEKYLSLLKTYNLQLYGKKTKSSSVILPTKIYDKTGDIVIGEFGGEKRKILLMSEIKKLTKIKTALIQSEDNNFYKHKGFSFLGMSKALLRTIVYRKVSGGSTITQQLAKQLFTKSERSIKRKILEIFCANMIEKRYTKESILAMYLNKIYFGHKRYGVEEAANYFFSRKAKDLTYAESSMLIAIVPNPSAFSPIWHLDRAMYKQRLVLRKLVKKNIITIELANKNYSDFCKRYRVPKALATRYKNILALKLPPLEGDEDSKWKSRIALLSTSYSMKKKKSAFLNDYIKNLIISKLGKEELINGLSIFTSIDANKQDAAWKSIKTAIRNLKAKYKKKMSGMKPEKLKEITDNLNGALVSINPVNGFVEALIGGYQFSRTNQLNRALYSKRQPGSSFKPFVYATALSEKKFGPFSIMIDEAVNFSGYKPHNYYSKYKGAIPLTIALARSVNTVAVKVLHKTSPSKLTSRVCAALNFDTSVCKKRLGSDLSMALGSKEMTVLEMASLYATLLNSGKRVKPILVLKIFDKNKNLIYGEDPYTNGKQVFDELASFQTLQMMETVLGPEGTVSYAYRIKQKNSSYLPFMLAGKTGSTQLAPIHKKKFKKIFPPHFVYRDAWFGGVSSNLATLIWIGNDKGYPLPGGGSSLAAPAWLDFYRRAFQEKFFSEADRINADEQRTVGLDENEQTENSSSKDDKESSSVNTKYLPFALHRYTKYPGSYFYLSPKVEVEIKDICYYSGKLAKDTCPYILEGRVFAKGKAPKEECDLH